MLSNCTLNTNMTDQAWRSREALDFNSRLLTLIDLFFKQLLRLLSNYLILLSIFFRFFCRRLSLYRPVLPAISLLAAESLTFVICLAITLSACTTRFVTFLAVRASFLDTLSANEAGSFVEIRCPYVSSAICLIVARRRFLANLLSTLLSCRRSPQVTGR